MMEFVFGYALGNMASGSSTALEEYRNSPTTSLPTEEQPRPSISPDVYINGPALERVVNPLEIRIGCCGWERFWDDDTGKPKTGLTYQSLFAYLPIKTEDFVVLRIIRILNSSNTSAAFWFEYIEKDKLKPSNEP